MHNERVSYNLNNANEAKNSTEHFLCNSLLDNIISQLEETNSSCFCDCAEKFT